MGYSPWLVIPLDRLFPLISYSPWWDIPLDWLCPLIGYAPWLVTPLDGIFPSIGYAPWLVILLRWFCPFLSFDSFQKDQFNSISLIIRHTSKVSFFVGPSVYLISIDLDEWSFADESRDEEIQQFRLKKYLGVHHLSPTL